MLIKPDEYECGDSEDGEDDELSCVIGESAGVDWKSMDRHIGDTGGDFNYWSSMISLQNNKLIRK